MLNYAGFGQLLNVYGRARKAQTRPLQDPQTCFMVGETPPGPLTKHLEQHASLTTLTPQNVATPDPMLQGNSPGLWPTACEISCCLLVFPFPTVVYTHNIFFDFWTVGFGFSAVVVGCSAVVFGLWAVVFWLMVNGSWFIKC